jgi:hypothetical protein
MGSFGTGPESGRPIGAAEPRGPPGGVVPAYEYRRLEVGWEDFEAAPGDRLHLHDSGAPDPLVLERGPGEGMAAFLARQKTFMLGYLNLLGQGGWRVLYYAPAVLRTPSAGTTLIADWPRGTHFLAREVPDEEPEEPAEGPPDGGPTLFPLPIHGDPASPAG